MFKLALKVFKEYADAASIHGINYTVCSKTSVVGRIIWLFVVCTGLSSAFLLSIQAYKQWKNNPVLTTLSTTGYPIEKIAFPTITICGQVSCIMVQLL